MPTQKTTLTRPASIAPGITAITALSTTSIVAIDKVSAATTTLERRAEVSRRAQQRQRRQREWKKNASAMESAIVRPLASPTAVLIIRPAISPTAQPVRWKCNVADSAIALMPPWRGGVALVLVVLVLVVLVPLRRCQRSVLHGYRSVVSVT